MPEWPYISEAQDLPDGSRNPFREPLAITAGDTVMWKRSIGAYPASQGWSLRYSIRGVPGAATDVASTPLGDDHQMTLAAGTTLSLPAGRYRMAGYAELASGERHTIYAGFLEVAPNLAGMDPDQDLRSHARICLDNIEAVLEGRATSDILESNIEGTQLNRIPVRDLLLFRDRYLLEVRSQEREAKAKAGRATGRNIFVRFTPTGR
jgi:hypothetical protein